ncbi:MAG TPA: 5-oxoprolinase subunit PxpA [Anaerolineaceae bacterium]|nr:5-oxoprolinase subunit PxpA [Anaerolineaceae bacterium]HPN52467.1 5-oxoprolinase subunit PxpA [Anaerolineaceae bacterium]
MAAIDLNSDLGESFGAYRLGDDAAMMPLITSANVACGFHAGDPLVMAATLRLARAAGVAVGAHPGYPDLQGFGRRDMDLTPEEAEACVLYQLGALAAFARAEGVDLVHVKPHGALYNQAARSPALAAAVARAVARFSPGLILVGLAGSALITAGREAGLRVAAEAFPDRAYNPDGSLRSRRLPGAVLEAPAEVAAQALNLAQNGVNGQPVDTLCLHGDNPAAVEHARAVNETLTTAGLILASLKCLF